MRRMELQRVKHSFKMRKTTILTRKISRNKSKLIGNKNP